MTAPIHTDTVLTRTKEALSLARTRTTPAAVARVIQCDRSNTGCRRSSDLKTWSVDEFVRLLCFDGQFRDEFASVLTEQADADPMSAEGDLRGLVGQVGVLIAHTMARLADNRLTAKEARDEVPELLDLREALDHAIAACRARAKAAR